MNRRIMAKYVSPEDILADYDAYVRDVSCVDWELFGMGGQKVVITFWDSQKREGKLIVDANLILNVAN